MLEHQHRLPICLAIGLLIGLVFELLTPLYVKAETKILTAEGNYIMGDGETPLVAESRALHNAKQMAVEQAGTYLQSHTKITNFQLTFDEIETIASAVVEVEVLEKRRTVSEGGFNFYVKISAKVKTDNLNELAKRIKRLGADPNTDLVSRYRKLQADYIRVAKEIDILKRQLSIAPTKQERSETADKIAKQARRYLAVELGQRAQDHYSKGENDQALVFFTKSLAEDPTYPDAYAGRASVLFSLGNFESSIKDFSAAIALGRKEWVDYFGRAGGFYGLGKWEQAISDLTDAIQIVPYEYPHREDLYLFRGSAYAQLEKYDLAVSDFTEAIQINPQHSDIADTYSRRAHAYANIGNLKGAARDISKACKLGDTASCMKVEEIRDRVKALKDRDCKNGFLPAC